MWTAAGTPGRRVLGQLDGVLLDEPDDEPEELEVEVLLDEEDEAPSPDDDELVEEDSLVDDEVDDDFLPESRLSVR